MPGPSSSTCSSTCPPPARTPTVTRVVANFSAFSTRLATIWPSRCASAFAGTAGPGATAVAPSPPPPPPVVTAPRTIPKDVSAPVPVTGAYQFTFTYADGQASYSGLVVDDGRTYLGISGAAIDASGVLIVQEHERGHAIQIWPSGATNTVDPSPCADMVAGLSSQAWTARLAPAWEVRGVRRGDVRVIPANTLHTLNNAGADPLDFVVVSLH